MPKTPHSQPPSPPKQAQAQANPDPAKMEIALRKKKNADAQAAFRARRANYIATLEETVTSLEAVVVQLQDSCREARGEATELRQENTRLTTALETLRHESREREKYLRALWHARKGSDDPHLDDFPPAPPSYASTTGACTGTASSSLGTPVTTPIPHPVAYTSPQTEAMDPRMQQYAQDPSVALQQAAYHEASANAYGERSPAMSFMTHDGDANGRNAAIGGMPKMNQYAYNSMSGHVRDNNSWHTVNQGGPSGTESVTGENGSTTHSPAYIQSPTMTSADATFAPRYNTTLMDAHNTHKTVLPGIDQVPYIMNNNDRSISPSASSTHNGSNSSVNSQFQFVFPTDGQERVDAADYHRRMAAAAPELTLHGGTADVSAYSMNRRRTNTGPERPMLGGGMPSFRPNESQAVNPNAAAEASKNGTDNGLSSAEPRGVRRRRNTGQSNGDDQSSRSPSPSSHAPISSTLAVIKAQAFGALRRTRARPKKATEGAAKMAMEVLEARGIGLGINSQNTNKRQRLSDDDGTSHS